MRAVQLVTVASLLVACAMVTGFGEEGETSAAVAMILLV